MSRSKPARRILLALLAAACSTISAAAAERMQNVEMVAISWTSTPSHPSMVSDLMRIGAPIRYRLRVDPGSACTLVPGFVERYWQDPGKRVMDVDAEGGEVTVVDVVKSVGHRMPYAVQIPCRDADGDGWLSVEIRMHPGVVDPNPLLNALWLFDRDYWTSNALNTDAVLTGKHDTRALYMIDAGVDGSELVEHDCTAEVARAADCLAVLQEQLAAHPSIEAEWGARVRGFDGSVSMIGAGSIAHGRAVVSRLSELKSAMREPLVKVYSPEYATAVDSRLFSPWGSLIRVRHEESLRVSMEASRRPESSDFRYHIPTDRLPFPGWVEFVPGTALSRVSARLGYGMNLDLKRVAYDPMKTVYSYGKGSIAVQVLPTSALGIFGNGVRFGIRFDREGMQHEGRLWYSKVSPNSGAVSPNEPLFMGVIADCDDITKEGATAANAALVWGGSIEELRSVASRVSRWTSIRRDGERWARQTDSALTLDGRAPYPAMMRLNRRAMTSMQYLSGPLFAALDGGYTNIWVRDTTSAVVHAALAGDPSLLERWTPYLMANPTRESLDGKEHTVFWAFPTMHIEKQQDGQFYATRSAYAYWKLTGDASKLKEWYPVLKSAMEYQRAVYYDGKLGLYCEININEAALKEAGEWAIGEQFADLKIGGIWPLRSFDLYINNLMYATHVMQAEMARELGITTDYVRNLRLARELAESVDRNLWDEKVGHYKCGRALLEDGRMVDFDWNYWDSFFDYAWAGTLYPMLPDPEKMLKSIEAMMAQRKGPWPGGVNFAPSFAHESYAYSAAGYSDPAESYLDVMTGPARKNGWNDEMRAQYVMTDAIIENMYVPYLHRPQTFTIGPWMHAVTARCAYLDCNGVTVVPGGMIASVNGARFRGAALDVDTKGAARPVGIIVDGKPVPGTLRVPIGLLTPGKHKVRLLDGPSDGPLLAHTDFELRGIAKGQDSATYTLYGYGCGVLRIEGGVSKVGVTDASGRPMPHRLWSARGGTRVQVDASGLFTVVVGE